MDAATAAARAEARRARTADRAKGWAAVPARHDEGIRARHAELGEERRINRMAEYEARETWARTGGRAARTTR